MILRNSAEVCVGLNRTSTGIAGLVLAQRHGFMSSFFNLLPSLRAKSWITMLRCCLCACLRDLPFEL
jgi:hypothetical protein